MVMVIREMGEGGLRNIEVCLISPILRVESYAGLIQRVPFFYPPFPPFPGLVGV